MMLLLYSIEVIHSASAKSNFSWLLMIASSAFAKLVSWLLPTLNAHSLCIGKIRFVTSPDYSLLHSGIFIVRVIALEPLQDNTLATHHHHLSITNMFKVFPCSHHHGHISQNRPTNSAIKLPLQAVTLTLQLSGSYSAEQATLTPKDSDSARK